MLMSVEATGSFFWSWMGSPMHLWPAAGEVAGSADPHGAPPPVGAGLFWADPGWPGVDSCALPHVVADPSAGQPGLVHVVGATFQGPPWALAWNQYATLQPKQVTGSAQIKREGCRSHLPRDGEELRLLW